jgi:hypothetical protein
MISVARHARIHAAAVTAIGKLAATWAHAADHYTQAVGMSSSAGSKAKPPRPSWGASRGSHSSHLRDVTTLSNIAVVHFSSELERTAAPREGAGVA